MVLLGHVRGGDGNVVVVHHWSFVAIAARVHIGNGNALKTMHLDSIDDSSSIRFLPKFVKFLLEAFFQHVRCARVYVPKRLYIIC
jgi:hypothetical protein